MSVSDRRGCGTRFPGRALLALAGVVVAALAAAPPAEAHPIGGVDYQFPLPLWLYALAAGVAVAVSAPVAAYATALQRPAVGGRSLYRARLGGRVALGARVLATALFAEIVVAGLFGSSDFTTNPATILVWVDFWVGVGIVSAAAGPVWDVVNPLAWLGRSLDASRDGPPLRYPRAVGAWPAALLLVGWSWLELAWPHGSDPFDLTVILVAYTVLQLVGIALFGTDVWLPRAELFTAFSRTLARAAPFEWYVRRPRVACAAELDHADERERVGCVTCWLAAAPQDRGIRWRGFTSGPRRDPALLPGGAALVVLLLSVVLYDGFRDTVRYVDLAQWMARHGPSWLGGTGIRTVTMALCVAVLCALFAGVIAVVAARAGEPLRVAVRRYAPTLVPIVAVYFCAHYLLYLFSYGQLTWKVILDPFETDWVPDLGVWTGYPSGIVWGFQVVVIVLGHIAAVVAAQRVAAAHEGRRFVALRAHAPLVALMVVYTVVGLWILGQTYQSA